MAAEPEPRYVATFRPGSPELVILAILVLIGAVLAVGLSWAARELVCGEKLQGDCDGGIPVGLVAIAGLIPALGMVVSSARQGGHPWRWFMATASVYALWGLAFMGWAG